MQALTAATAYGNARRMAAGFDHNRMALLLAVLEKKARLPLGNQDAYINVAGGLRLDDPGADLAVCAAVASSFFSRPVPQDTAFIGEVGLTGEVRAVQQMQRRIASGYPYNRYPLQAYPADRESALRCDSNGG